MEESSPAGYLEGSFGRLTSTTSLMVRKPWAAAQREGRREGQDGEVIESRA